MDILKFYHTIVVSYYKKNIHNIYKSLTEIVTHVAEHDTWNITNTLQHRQIQVVARPCYRYM